MNEILHNILNMLSYDPSAPMLFTSGLFWALFIIFVPVYALLKRRRWQMMLFVILFSLYFYYKSSGVFFLLLVATSAVDYLISKQIARTESKLTKRALLIVSVVISTGVLAYFKYANFLLSTWTDIIGGNFQPLDIILPIGISFYTFRSISYVVDVYRGKISPAENWIEYLFFLSFFPALLAGPIVRADVLLPQIRENRQADRHEIYIGLWLIIIGVVKKAVFADYIAQYNNLIFDNPTGYSGFESLMGAIGYTMQIYCDFSGYSDMAIGISSIMGFQLPANFNLPYKSKNLTEFWHRWHISLSTWLRDYIYIPLGGNRKGKFRTYLNNFLTMLIGGLWHGASWKFVFWGAMHGGGLIVHKMCRPWLKEIPDTWHVKAISWLLTMTVVTLLWVFFRADSFADAAAIVVNIFTTFDLAYAAPFFEVRYVWCIMMVLMILTHALPTQWIEQMGEGFVGLPWLFKLVIFVLTVQLVLQFMSADVAPFIYNQF